jgi:hypothetical protein
LSFSILERALGLAARLIPVAALLAEYSALLLVAVVTAGMVIFGAVLHSPRERF